VARVLFVCRQNAGRSQMSEALFARAGAGRHEARSAGTAPADKVHPEVVTVMRELGADLEGCRPEALSEGLAEWADVVVTMGCGDACPLLPGRRHIDWSLEDPHGQPLATVRRIRDDIAARVVALAAELDGAPVPER
jgi:arsenate reductase (thioredoxin)